jgi:hypothetical protein
MVLMLTIASSAGAAERVFVQRVPGAEQTLYVRPHVFYLSADGALTVTGVKWRSYGGRTATASAIAHTNDCEPFCLGGTFSTHPTKLRLTGRKYCRARKREIYTRLDFHILGDIPTNFGDGRGSISLRPLTPEGDPLC